MASSSRPQYNSGNQSILVCSIASSNETADNILGPGRILGNVLSSSGRRLERRLGIIADNLGFGPRATAVRIQRRRKAITTRLEYPLLPGPFGTDGEKIEKDCRRLVRYVRSNTASTKKQALDWITELSIDDGYIRGLFKVVGAVDAIEPLQRDPAVWIYYGPSLQNSSRKALVSLTDVEINMVLRTADVRISMFEEEDENDSLLNGTLREIFAYLYDPDRSFIVVRHADKLTRTANSKFFQMWLLHFDGDNDADNFLNAHYYMYLLLQGVAQNVNGDGSRKTNDVDDVDLDNVHINTTYLQATYPHIYSQSFLRRATCPPDLVMCKIARRRRGRIYGYSSAAFQPTELETLCLEIARYVDSNDAVLRERALRCASVLLYTDVYCRAAMMRAFTSTKFAATSGFAEMIKETRSLCGSPLYPSYGDPEKLSRCCYANGNLLHITDDTYYMHRKCAGERKYSLEMNMYDVLALRVPRGTAFSSASHYPLLAGYMTGGKPTYVAKCFKSGVWRYRAVIEGARPEDECVLLDSTCFADEMRVHLSFVDVFVLRHAPAVYAESGRSAKAVDSGEVLDATGPFFWKPV
ncbi:hypothetical protein M0805_005819 [Coniferiporia weirii]|nr:hypothetical protein M0805_005819 [Coniferiporia weirii]